jgi:hypothetical protein
MIMSGKLTGLAGLRSKLSRLEKKYDKADGKPIVQARILKSAEATQKQIDKIEGDN